MELSLKQKEAVSHLIREPRVIVWHKIGEGKTRVALAWMLNIREVIHPLIVCSPLAFRQWQDEINLVGLQERIQPVFLSYGMLSAKKAAHKVNLLLERVLIDCLVLDELWLYKNPRSKRSLLAQQLSRMYYTIGLSGSMITNKNIEDLYGQACAVGLGDKVAKSLTDFREQFCVELLNYAGFIERIPKRHAVENIQHRLREDIHVYFPKETKEIRDIHVNIDPTKEQMELRKKLINEYYLELDQANEESKFTLEIKNGAALLLKLQQISDGFIYDSQGNHISIRSTKLQRLIQHISELLDGGERVIVWFGFRQSIQEALKLSTFPTVVLYSGERFDADRWAKGEAKVCYATLGSGSSLNDFAQTRYAIVYSTSYSYRMFEQAKGRTNRKSSEHNICYYYYFQTLGFPDAKIYQMLYESKTTQELVINVTRRVIQEYLAEKEMV